LLVRPYEAGDQAQVEALKRKQGFAYDSPEWEKMLVSCVIEEDDRIRMAAFLRKTSEVYLVVDQDAGRQRDKLANLLALHREMLTPMRRVGFTDTHCWMPPEIEKTFGPLLLHLGWRKPLWPSYSFEVPAETRQVK
jgi:hypothetical protein